MHTRSRSFSISGSTSPARGAKSNAAKDVGLHWDESGCADTVLLKKMLVLLTSLTCEALDPDADQDTLQAAKKHDKQLQNKRAFYMTLVGIFVALNNTDEVMDFSRQVAEVKATIGNVLTRAQIKTALSAVQRTKGIYHNVQVSFFFVPVPLERCMHVVHMRHFSCCWVCCGVLQRLSSLLENHLGLISATYF